MNTSGLSILVVEDDILIAIDIQGVLEQAGHRVIGPATSTDAAMGLLGQGFPHLAFLDINLRGAKAFGLADVLAGAGTTVIFLSGHSRGVLPDAHKDRRLIQKPYLPAALVEAADEESRRRQNGP